MAALHAIPQLVVKVKDLDNRMNMAEAETRGLKRQNSEIENSIDGGTAYLGDCPYLGNFILRDP